MTGDLVITNLRGKYRISLGTGEILKNCEIDTLRHALNYLAICPINNIV